jgi:hypothetical protein
MILFRRGNTKKSTHRTQGARSGEYGVCFLLPFTEIFRRTAYIVTLRRVRVTIVAVEINEYYILWVCVFSLRYPVRNAHVPYCYLWPAPLYNIFPRYLKKGHDFRKKSYLTQNVYFYFIYKFVQNISHSKKKWARYDQNCILVFI